MWVDAFASIVWLHSPTAPTATGWIFGSTARIASTTALCFSTYFASGMWPICQSPYISLPTAHSFTPKGRELPFSARLRPNGVVAAPLAYSTSSRADSGPPLPVLTAT